MKKLLTLFYLLPRFHRAAISLIAILTFGFIVITHEHANASRGSEVHSTENDNFSSAGISTPRKTKSTNTKEIKPPQITTQTKKFEVKKGDTLASIFHQAGLSAQDVFHVSQLPMAKQYLLKLIPKEIINLELDDQGNLISVSKPISPISKLNIKRNNDTDTYNEKITTKDVDKRTQFAQGQIKSNFWNAAVDAGLSPNQIMELSTIFSWDIDFSLDLRKGDSFAIIYEQKFANDKFLKNGNILAAEFVNQGQKYTAVRYQDGNYYSASGQSLKKAFLRSPVDFRYVSSNFNPTRRHPVTGSIKAHRGVDYVAPIGTPIKAAGNGRVIQSSYNRYNGNYVFIKHNETYTTKYLHLNKRNVKRGQVVKQGQTIGTLGRTGRVTGAHLHYEFIVNGVHRNPRTISLPVSSPISANEKQHFAKVSDALMKKIEQNKQIQLAREEIQ